MSNARWEYGSKYKEREKVASVKRIANIFLFLSWYQTENNSKARLLFELGSSLRKEQFLAFAGYRVAQEKEPCMRVLWDGLERRIKRAHVYSSNQITYERSLREALIFTYISRVIRRKISCTYNYSHKHIFPIRIIFLACSFSISENLRRKSRQDNTNCNAQRVLRRITNASNSMQQYMNWWFLFNEKKTNLI